MPTRKTSRDEILIQSMLVFRKQGYHSTSISDLAKACDIPKSHFYYYFTNKADLMQAILESVNAYFTEKVLPIARDQSMSEKERLTLIMGKFQRVFARDFNGCIMGNTTLEMAHLDSAELFMPLTRTYFESILDALSTLYASAYEPTQAREYAEQVVQDIEGGIILMQVYRDPDYVIKAIKRALNLLA